MSAAERVANGRIASVARTTGVAVVLLACQACTDAGALEGGAAPTADARFSMAGVLDGPRHGVAWTRLDEYSRGHLFDIRIADSREDTEQTYHLLLRGESKEGGLPAPGQYPIVSRADSEKGYAGGFMATYTHIIENRGGRYAHVALEYTAAPAWKGHGPGGILVIESVDTDTMTGRFELDLREDGSINKAPRRDEKSLRVRGGRFSARLGND